MPSAGILGGLGSFGDRFWDNLVPLWNHFGTDVVVLEVRSIDLQSVSS